MHKMVRRPREYFSFAASLLFLQQAPVVRLDRITEPAPAHREVRAAHYSPRDGWVTFNRFWRSDKNTLVDAMVRVPALQEGSVDLPLQLQIVVEDDAGNVLLNESWADSTRTPSIESGTAREIATPLRFVVANGRYRMRVHAQRGDVSDSSSVVLEAFPDKPLTSDLLLSPSIRRIASGDKLHGAEVAHGDFAVVTAPSYQVTDVSTPLWWYYLELYPEAGEIGQQARLDFEIVRESDGKHFKGARKQVAMNMAGVIEVGRLGLDQLTAGRYRLEVTVTAPERKEVRRAAFTVVKPT